MRHDAVDISVMSFFSSVALCVAPPIGTQWPQYGSQHDDYILLCTL